MAFGFSGEEALRQTTFQTQAPAQKTAKVLQAEAMQMFKPSLFPESIKEASGMGNVNINAATGEVWMSAMFGSPSGDPVANVGFKSNSLQNSGTTDWTGVTITAAYDGPKSAGFIMFHVGAEENTGGGWTPCAENHVLSGVTAGTATSQPFTMKPGAKYRGRAWFALEKAYNRASPGKPIGYSGKITSIKFNFP
jgi:hypothetical protein